LLLQLPAAASRPAAQQQLKKKQLKNKQLLQLLKARLQMHLLLLQLLKTSACHSCSRQLKQRPLHTQQH
jgi:hypothetical protein